MKIQYTLRVEAELLERAKAVAEEEMRSLNNVIEVAIHHYCARQDGLNEILDQLDELSKKYLDADKKLEEWIRKSENQLQAEH